MNTHLLWVSECWVHTEDILHIIHTYWTRHEYEYVSLWSPCRSSSWMLRSHDRVFCAFFKSQSYDFMVIHGGFIENSVSKIGDNMRQWDIQPLASEFDVNRKATPAWTCLVSTTDFSIHFCHLFRGHHRFYLDMLFGDSLWFLICSIAFLYLFIIFVGPEAS